MARRLWVNAGVSRLHDWANPLRRASHTPKATGPAKPAFSPTTSCLCELQQHPLRARMSRVLGKHRRERVAAAPGQDAAGVGLVAEDDAPVGTAHGSASRARSAGTRS